MTEEYNSTNRFGGGWHWKISDDEYLRIGETIEAEGPGKGVTMFPWALDRYERVLRLRPGEAWLLKRMLKHAWKFKGQVFISMSKVTRQAIVSRMSLYTWIQRLVKLNYVTPVGDDEKSGHPRRYDVSGIYAALALCIAADPGSKWSQERGEPLPVDKIRGLRHNGKYFDLDFEALEQLDPQNNGV